MRYKAYVTVDGNFIQLDKCEFLDISEDMYGRDVVKFIFKGKEYESYVINK